MSKSKGKARSGPAPDSPLIPCGCGCGRLIAEIDRQGRRHRFVRGHTSLNGRPFEERFWSFVDKSGDCWLWTGHRTPGGYGTIARKEPGHRSAPVRANRASWEIHYGPIAPGLNVCHRCDTPACVRPDHLFLGTDYDNVMDAVAKGRIVPPHLRQRSTPPTRRAHPRSG